MKRTEKRYYKIGEKVFVKETKEIGVITDLTIDPANNIFKATVEVTKQDGDATIITKRVYDLWEIDKNKRTLFKDKHKSKLTVPVKYFDENIEKIEFIQVGDWIDLRSRVDINIKQFDSYKIPLNVAMQLPQGYEAHILPRSSTFDTWGIMLANSKGVVDNSYSGNNDEWLFNAVAIKGDATIKKGDRIAQFKIERKMDKEKFNFMTVERLLNENRGGFGTTGSN